MLLPLAFQDTVVTRRGLGVHPVELEDFDAVLQALYDGQQPRGEFLEGTEFRDQHLDHALKLFVGQVSGVVGHMGSFSWRPGPVSTYPRGHAGSLRALA